MEPFLCKVRGIKLFLYTSPKGITNSNRSHSSLVPGVTQSHWDQVQVGEVNQPTHYTSD